MEIISQQLGKLWFLTCCEWKVITSCPFNGWRNMHFCELFVLLVTCHLAQNWRTWRDGSRMHKKKKKKKILRIYLFIYLFLFDFVVDVVTCLNHQSHLVRDQQSWALRNSLLANHISIWSYGIYIGSLVMKLDYQICPASNLNTSPTWLCTWFNEIELTLILFWVAWHMRRFARSCNVP